MGTEISLFSQKSFIEASKKFVCVRLGTYESKEHQDMVRKLLRGTFQNTAFIVYAPDGKTALTRAGRGPHHAFGKDTEKGMADIAKKYKPKATTKNAVLTDFHSFKQSLNVAAADQRLLVYTVASQNQLSSTLSKVKAVFNDPAISGRFFYDTVSKGDEKWASKLKGVTKKTGVFIIRSGKYGTDGTVMKELPLNATKEQIKKALITANAEYAKTEKRKVYNEHVSAGKKEGVNFENTMPPGEDRDGDGKIDPKRGRR